MIANWTHENQAPKRGRPFTYSDQAIESLLAIREIFKLPYRATEGFAKSLVKLTDIDLSIPDFTSLAKRAGKHRVDLGIENTKKSLHIVVDSTGLKVYGEGEWKTRQHGVGKRRTWRKLHLAIDVATQQIVAETLTTNSIDDASEVEPLLKEISGTVETFGADGAYDKFKVYERLAESGIEPIIPPRKDAKIKKHGNASGDRHERDEAIRGIRKKGRKKWKKESGYHKRSLAETGMFRVKKIFGGELKNRTFENQKTETRLRIQILNTFETFHYNKIDWSTKPFSRPISRLPLSFFSDKCGKGSIGMKNRKIWR